MTKRDRELKQRLTELFSESAAPEPADDLPPAPAPSTEAAAPAGPIDLTLLKSVIEHLPQPVYLKDADHTWVAVSPAFAALLGQPADTLAGHVDKEQSDEAWQLDDQVLTSGQPDDVQETISQPDGSLRTRRVRRTPLGGENGSPRYLLGTIDETIKGAPTADAERNALLDELAEQRDNAARFQTIAEATPVPVLITRLADGRPLYVNARASDLFGVPQSEILYHSTPEFYDDPAERGKILALLKRDGHISDYELRLKRPDGQRLWVSLSVQPISFHGQAAVLSSFYDISRRKAVEEQLRDSEALYQSLVQAIPENLCRKDVQGRFTYGNEKYCRGVGLSLSELIGKTDYDIHPPELAEAYRADDQRVMAEGKSSSTVEAHIVLGSNETTYVRTLKAPVYDHQGQLAGVQIMFWDVTDQIRAEQELKLRTSALEAAADGIAITDRLGNMVWINQAFTRITGYSPEEALGQNPRILKSGRQSDEYYQRMWQAIMAGEVWSDELINRRKDGSEYVSDLTVTPVRGPEGSITHFIAVQRDITQRKRDEAERLKTAHQIRTLLDTIPDTVFVKNIRGEFELVNRATARQNGAASPDEMIGKTDFDYHSPERAAQFWADEQSLLQSGQPLLAHEETVVDPDGNIIYLLTSKVPYRNEAGEIAGLVGIGRDITALKRAEAERERLLAEQQKRAVQVQTGAEIAVAASTILNVDELLPVVVELIRERFDLYYVGLFLTDAHNDYAILQAGTGEAGRKMLENGHRLPVGGTSMIGRCIATSEARIALDVGAEAVRFDNPLLPFTRSEMALPLISRGQTIGALTIQSTQLQAFQPDDIAALQTMARQVAIAIDNARLLGEFSRQTAELTTLNQIAVAVSQITSPAELLQSALKITLEAIGYEAGLAAQPDPDSGNLKITTHFNLPAPLIEKFEAQGLGGTLCEYVFNSGAQLSIADLRQGAPVNVGALVAHGLLSYTGVPLKYQDRSLGTLCMFGQSVRHLPPGKATLLTSVSAQLGIGLENTNLFAQARLRAQELSALNDLSQALSSRLDVQQVVNEVYRGVSRLLDTSNFYIGVYDAARNEVQFMINATESALDRQITVMPADRGLTGYILRTRQSLLIKENVTAWQEKMGIPRVGDPAHSWLGVPLMVGDQILGVMAIQSYSADRIYTERDRDLMQAIGNQAAIALQNALLFAQTQTALTETERLYSASQRLYTAPDWQAMLAAVAEVLSQPVINRAVLLLFQADEIGEITSADTVANWHNGRGTPPTPIGTHYPLDVFKSSHLVRSREAMVFNNVTTDPRVDDATREVLVRQNIQAMVAVPLWAGSTQLGVLLLESEEPHHFEAGDTRLIEALSQQLALSIENRQLLEQTQRTAQRERTLNRIASQIREAHSVEQVLAVAARELRLATGAALSVAELQAADAAPAAPHKPSGNGQTGQGDA